MFDYISARETMIDCQIRPADVTDRRILAAFAKTPREIFVPRAKLALAYGDSDIPLDGGRVMISPRDLAKMVSAAEISPAETALIIGSGRGYAVAILAQLAETAIGLDSDEEATSRASKSLLRCEINNAAFVTGELKPGAAQHGPFDVILVNGAVADIPQQWAAQLSSNGRIIAPIIDGPVTRICVFTKSGDTVGRRILFDSAVPALPEFMQQPAFAL